MRSALKQIWVMCGAYLNLLSCGYQGGFTPILFRDLRRPDSEIQLNSEAESWVVSAVAITTFPSILLLAIILQIRGRISAHICIVLPNLIACLILYFAKDVTALVIARLVSGFSLGSTIFVAAIIIGEYSSPDYRGVFLNTKAACVTLGILMVHLAGIFFEWRTTALIGVIPSTLSLLSTITWRESPSWLAYKGRYEECIASFKWLRGDSDKAKEELLLLMQAQKNRRLCKIRDHSKIHSIKSNLSRLTRKDFIKPSLIVLFVFVVIESCGRHSFAAYAVKFMSAFTIDNSKTLYYVLAVDTIIFISSACSCGVVKLFRRRTILFTSGVVACSLLICICVYLYLKSQGIAPEGNVLVPMSLLLLYFIIINVGVAPIAMASLGEVYPLEHKGLGAVVSGLFFSLSLLTALKVTPGLIRTLEVYGTFLVYSACMAGSLLYLYFFLPETEGKTLQEIEHHFNGISLRLQNDTDVKLLHT